MKILLSIALFLCFSCLFSCKQENKVSTSDANKNSAAPIAQPVEKPKEDYTKVFFEVARKEYEPLGRKILENKKMLETSINKAEGKSANNLKQLESQQYEMEKSFVGCMKTMNDLDDFEGNKQMTKEEIKKERRIIAKQIKELQMMSSEFDKKILNNTQDTLKVLR